MKYNKIIFKNKNFKGIKNEKIEKKTYNNFLKLKE